MACFLQIPRFRGACVASVLVAPKPSARTRERRGAMCDRHGSQDFSRSGPKRAEPSDIFKGERSRNDHHGGAGRHDGVAGRAHAASTIKGTHGNGFCNVAFFITHARQLAKDDGLTLEFVNTPSFADQVTFLGTWAGRRIASCHTPISWRSTTQARRSRSSPAAACRVSQLLLSRVSTRQTSSRARRSEPSRTIRWKCCHTTG